LSRSTELVAELDSFDGEFGKTFSIELDRGCFLGKSLSPEFASE
jgi:hypothetical protein